MTTESQKAFEEWVNPLSMTTMVHETAVRVFAERAWQASEARILAMLESDGVEVAAKAMWNKHKLDMGDAWYTDEDTWETLPEAGRIEFIKSAKAALKEIVEGI